ncbi:MAG: [protein-PII] uridylyltransferase [Desulfobacteraceae bacterium]|uniref:Bifunctional uridylyltransferase/uridylyl-removing enzyme n=1 Tax=Candidatus Desulfacyla euxinica TaxID=2841693 RepID=A0A8J6T3N4_9DELT|nr:[protein-PII] uridylyltransferase [Candidatus Desulfacyla euxinica]MBL6978905.1 [protein-PII] uridylyltransferase [Desulfobacteraceae bacterium]
MTSAFEEFKESRNHLISRFSGSKATYSFQENHTEIMDQYFRGGLQDSNAGHRLFKEKTPFAFLAVGGYGRKELSLCSDVDILILFSHKIPSLAKELAEEIFYPLWDLGIELGYGTRTIKDCLKLCKSDFQVLTSMMDSRFLCGDSPLYLHLMEDLKQKIISKKAVAFCRWLEDFHDIRMETFGDASHLLEPNLKEGLGGLRDYHQILWVANALFGLRAPRDLEYLGKLSHNEYQELREHLEFIWIVRNFLHQLSNRRNDRLSFEYQEQIAQKLSFKDQDNFLAVEQFMGRLHSSMASIKSLNRSFVRTHFPDGRGNRKQYQASDVTGGLHIHDGEIEFDSAIAIVSNPVLLMTIFEESSRLGCPLSMEARRLVREFLFFVDDRFKKSEKAVEGFLDIINGKNTFETLSQMHEIGFLEAYVPEYGQIKDRVQFDAYHIYPVGRHSLETLRYLKNLNHQNDILLLDIFSELQKPESLFMAGLFHDIGKTGKDHARKGEAITRKILSRFDCHKIRAEDVLFLVRYHLLLVETATRRDLNDEKAVVQCARIVGDVGRLKMLYLLTWADSMATGPTAWNDWIASLVNDLFFKILHILEKGELASLDASKRVEITMSEVRREMFQRNKNLDPNGFIDVMSPRYLLASKPLEIVRHVEIAQGLKGQLSSHVPSPFCLDIRENELDECREITVMANDRPGLFSDVAGVLALNNINIFSAEIYTWRDGIAVDIFKVMNSLDPIKSKRDWYKIKEDLKRTFTGKLSLTYRLGKKGEPSILSNDKKPARIPRVMVDNGSSDFFTIIEVFADDRVGLLYLLTRTLFDLRLDIRIAKIATKGDQIADVFYVRDLEGQKVEDKEHVKEIKDALSFMS